MRWALLLLVLGGCAVGPTYKAQPMQVPSTWGRGEAEPVPARWWTGFGDEELTALVHEAAAANLDLRVAEARVREARAQRGVIAGGEAPQIGAQASYEHERLSKRAAPFDAIGNLGAAKGFPWSFDAYQAGFDASWELDIFGGTRRAAEAATADEQAAVEGRREVLVSLLGEVARNYVELRSAQVRLVIARNNIATQEQTLDVTQHRLQNGVGGAQEVSEARELLALTRAAAPPLEQEALAAMHRLAVLVGREPDALLDRLSRGGQVPRAHEVGAGMPSDLLRRRPDIGRAERELAAATARVGVATADLFPRFSLTGNFGVASTDLGTLLQKESRTYAGGPAVQWPLFAGGSIRENIKVQDARVQEAQATYERTVLTALAEVSDALSARGRERARLQILAEGLRAGRRTVTLARQRYENGVGTFLELLDAERSLYGIEDQLAQSRTALSLDVVMLYKALGGGWESLESPEGR